MKIKLLKPHRHAGKNYSVGEVLDVDTDTSNYLADLKVATPTGDSPQQSQSVKPSSQVVQPQVHSKGKNHTQEAPKVAPAIVASSAPSVDPVGVNQPTGDTPEIG